MHAEFDKSDLNANIIKEQFQKDYFLNKKDWIEKEEFIKKKCKETSWLKISKPVIIFGIHLIIF